MQATQTDTTQQHPDDFVRPLSDLTLDMIPLVGGKNASLGEMLRYLTEAGVRVPDGFALTTHAYRAHLRDAGIEHPLFEHLERVWRRHTDVEELMDVSETIREMIVSAPLPKAVAAQARAAYERLSAPGGKAVDVAVRSSATAEDLPTASFAGQQDTYLNVQGWPALEFAIRKCMASLFTARAIAYRNERGIDHRDVALSVSIQKMVRSDIASAGVIFTLDTESGFRNVVLVTAAWGLGELVVKGTVNPDEYWVYKPALEKGSRAILRREMGEKKHKLVYGEANAVQSLDVSKSEQRMFALQEDEVLQLARWAVLIENHYTQRAGRWTPMDIEWAKDGRTGELFIVQARPETVHAQRQQTTSIERFELLGSPDILISGKAVGHGVGTGRVRCVTDPRHPGAFKTGDVLVAELTDPDWEPLLQKAAAVVTDKGGRTCHAAIVSRELGLPCIVGTGSATKTLEEGSVVTVSCAEGSVGNVYSGEVAFERSIIDADDLPVSPVPLMLNLARPEIAFELSRLPVAGVGLLRVEFLVNHWIGIHPMALLHPERIEDPREREQIQARIEGYDNPMAFFVERMASGIALIAAAFYPRPVIVRFSDFKTSEYARLLGGSAFEPMESNPMLGWRGASRYAHPGYSEGFALECQAILRLRREMGLDNVRVMIPFCRTLKEAHAVIAELEKNGLKRGENGLEVWMMCEIPNNALLAHEFSLLFDGFSIGSNDLTQLTLGIDRDSALLASSYDERDPGVELMVRMAVKGAHHNGIKIGFCGQAPSDHPDFAVLLHSIGIDSISLSPDALLVVSRALSAH